MRWARARKKEKSVFKNPARSLPREWVVMRFSSNEGQNMAPDVILILIKEGRVVMGWGVLESILLNTINPFFIFEGNKGRREWIQAQRHALDHGSLFWRHGGRRPVIKEEAGPERLGQHLMPSIPPPPPAWQRWGGVCPPFGVTRDDSLPWGEERGGSSAPRTQDFHEKGTSFLTHFF